MENRASSIFANNEDLHYKACELKRNIDNSRIMALAVQKALHTCTSGIGGPFGAVIVDKSGTIISIASNSVLIDKDPTAHAEINAIRQAGIVLGTHDLTGCTLYATGYPCPMCMSAIIWSNIKTVYYGTTIEQANELLGFRDEDMYKQLQDLSSSGISLTECGSQECVKLFIEYQKLQGIIY